MTLSIHPKNEVTLANPARPDPQPVPQEVTPIMVHAAFEGLYTSGPPLSPLKSTKIKFKAFILNLNYCFVHCKWSCC